MGRQPGPGAPARSPRPYPGEREARHHPELPGPPGRRDLAQAVFARALLRPEEPGHPRPPDAAVVGGGREPDPGTCHGTARARAHRRAGARVAHRRAVLQVAPPPTPEAPDTHPHDTPGASRMLIIQRPTVEAIGEEEANRQ